MDTMSPLDAAQCPSGVESETDPCNEDNCPGNISRPVTHCSKNSISNYRKALKRYLSSRLYSGKLDMKSGVIAIDFEISERL